MPKVLTAFYELRNNRAIGHVSAEVSPHHMDAEFFLRGMKWVMGELVRNYSQLPLAWVRRQWSSPYPASSNKSGGDSNNSKAEQPCAFVGLSAPSLAAAAPFLLAAAILFVLALGMRPLALPGSTAPPYLRPPLMGLPLY